MRPAMGAVLLACVVLWPGAVASPGTEPVIFESTFVSPPRVGEEVELRVRVIANVAVGPTHLRLEVPDWVEVRGGDEWVVELGRGESAEHVWTIVAMRMGFWRVGMSHPTGESMGNPVDPEAERQVVNGCCLHVFSSEDDARWSRHTGLAMPSARFETRLLAELVEGDLVRVSLDAELMEPWAPLARIDARVGHMGFEHAVLEVALADGQSVVVTEWATASVSFDRSELLREGEVLIESGSVGHCRNVELTRTGGTVSQSDAWMCEAAGGKAWKASAPTAGLVVGCLVLAALGRRPRGA